MKIIDIKTKGNVFRIYLGEDDCEPYGDDWDDTPYEYNAGTVYDEFVKGYIDYALDLNHVVLEPKDCYNGNSRYCKNDMIEQKVAALAVVELKNKEYSWMFDSFDEVSTNKRTHLVYLNDTFDKNNFKWAKQLKEVYINEILNKEDE